MRKDACKADFLKCLWAIPKKIGIVAIIILLAILGLIPLRIIGLRIPDIFFADIILVAGLFVIYKAMLLISEYIQTYLSYLKQGRILILPWEIRIKKAYYRFKKRRQGSKGLFILEQIAISTISIWLFIFGSLVISDLSQRENYPGEKLEGIAHYVLESLHIIYSADFIAPILLLTVVLITIKLFKRAKNTLIIDYIKEEEKNDEKERTPNYHLLLIEELNSIFRLYGDVDEQRPIRTAMAEKCDVTSAALMSGEQDTILNNATTPESKISFGPVSVPSGFLLSLMNSILRGPRLLLTEDREGEIIRVSALLVSPRNLSWQVSRRIPEETEKRQDIESQTKKQANRENAEERDDFSTEMISELAYRIFTGMTRGNTQRWESTRAFITGLYNYRMCLRTPKERIKHLNAAEGEFLEALEYDQGYQFAWYNLGVVYSEMERYEAAEEAFSRATEIDQSRWEPYYAWAITALHGVSGEGEKRKSNSTKETAQNEENLIDQIIQYFKEAEEALKKPDIKNAENKLNEAKEKLERAKEILEKTDTIDIPERSRDAIGHLNQAERVLKKKNTGDVPEVFKVRGETHLRLYTEIGQGDLYRAIQDLQDATLAAWRRYQGYLASSPTTVSELAREETACRLMQESLISLAHACYHRNKKTNTKQNGEVECLVSNAVSIDPTCPEAHFACGRMHLRTGQWEGAVEAFKTAVEIAPHMTKYHLALALSYLLCGSEKDQSVEAAKKILERTKEEDGIEYHNVGDIVKDTIYCIYYQIKSATSAIEKTIGKEEYALTTIQKNIEGIEYYLNKTTEFKVQTASKNQKLPQTHKDSDPFPCEKYDGENTKSQIRDAWQEHWNKPIGFHEHYKIGCIHYLNGRYARAIQWWEAALPLAPYEPRVPAYIGIASVKQAILSHPPDFEQLLAKGRKHLKNALQVYQHRLLEAPEMESDGGTLSSNDFMKGIGRTYYWIGRLSSIRQDYVGAIRNFMAARQILGPKDGGEIVPTYRLAWAYLKNRNYDLAEAEFKRIIPTEKYDFDINLWRKSHCISSIVIKNFRVDYAWEVSLGKDLEEGIRIMNIWYCSYLGLVYSHILRGIISEESTKYLKEAKEIKENLKNETYSPCYDYCLGLSRYTEYFSGPGNRRWLLVESITHLTNGLKSRPTAGKFLALARACTTLGELDEVRPEEDAKKVQNIPARMPNLSRARECLILARKMDYYGRHTEEIETLQKRVERCLGIPAPEK